MQTLWPRRHRSIPSTGVVGATIKRVGTKVRPSPRRLNPALSIGRGRIASHQLQTDLAMDVNHPIASQLHSSPMPFLASLYTVTTSVVHRVERFHILCSRMDMRTDGVASANRLFASLQIQSNPTRNQIGHRVRAISHAFPLENGPDLCIPHPPRRDQFLNASLASTVSKADRHDLSVMSSRSSKRKGIHNISERGSCLAKGVIIRSRGSEVSTLTDSVSSDAQGGLRFL